MKPSHKKIAQFILTTIYSFKHYKIVKPQPVTKSQLTHVAKIMRFFFLCAVEPSLRFSDFQANKLHRFE